MKNGLKTTYSLMWGQCSEATRSNLQSLPVFKQARYDYIVIAIIELIQCATFDIKKHTYLYNSINGIQQKNRRFFQIRGWNLM